MKDPRDAVVILEDDTALLRLGDRDFVERLQSYLDLAPTLREYVPAIDYVDLRFGDKVYVGGAGQQGRRWGNDEIGVRCSNIVCNSWPRGSRPARQRRRCGTQGTVSGRARCRHLEDLRGRRGAGRRAGDRHHRHRRRPNQAAFAAGWSSISRPPSRRSSGRSRKPRAWRGSRSTRSTSGSAAPISRGSTAAASSRSPGRTARSPRMTCGARSTPPRRSRCRAAGTSCTCCRRISSSTNRTAWTTR